MHGYARVNTRTHNCVDTEEGLRLFDIARKAHKIRIRTATRPWIGSVKRGNHTLNLVVRTNTIDIGTNPPQVEWTPSLVWRLSTLMAIFYSYVPVGSHQ
eukprot:COSAG01_NODE_7302_length_3261_cov_1.785895_3_plen_99_part_00